MIPSDFEASFGRGQAFQFEGVEVISLALPQPAETIFPEDLARHILPAIVRSDILHRTFSNADVASLLPDESGSVPDPESIAPGLKVLVEGGSLAVSEGGYSATDQLKEAAPSIVEALAEWQV